MEKEILNLLKDIKTHDFNFFLEVIKNNHQGDLNQRLDLLDKIHCLLESEAYFSKLSKNSRYLIGGKSTSDVINEFNVDAGLFGSMKGAGAFIGILNKSPEILDNFISKIPREGIIDKYQYLYLAEIYKSSLIKNGIEKDFFVPFTRILSVIRPDIFICYNNGNNKIWLKYVNLNSKISDRYEYYWDNIIAKTKEFKWHKPSDMKAIDNKIWNYRVALLDTIFYQVKSTKENTKKTTTLTSDKKMRSIDIENSSDGNSRFSLFFNLSDEYWEKYIPEAMEEQGFEGENFSSIDEEDQEMVADSAKYNIFSEHIIDSVVCELFDLRLVGDVISVHTGYGSNMYLANSHDALDSEVPGDFWSQLEPDFIPLHVVIKGMTNQGKENIEEAESTASFVKMSRSIDFSLVMRNSDGSIVMQDYLDGDLGDGYFKDPEDYTLGGKFFDLEDKISKDFLLS